MFRNTDSLPPSEIDKARLGEYIGRLDSKTLAAVDRAIVVSLGIKYLEELIHGR